MVRKTWIRRQTMPFSRTRAVDQDHSGYGKSPHGIQGDVSLTGGCHSAFAGKGESRKR